jgi:hypothetical protein
MERRIYMHSTRWIVVSLLVAVVVATAPVASARKPKESISAVVNGHRVKFGRKLVSTSGSAESGSFATGGAQQPHRLGQTLKGLVFGCAVALASPVFPVDGQFCTMGYSETKFSRNLTIKQWAAAVDGVRVTVTAFDGTHASGTFDGVLPPADPNADYGPVTVQNGKFNVILGE